MICRVKDNRDLTEMEKLRDAQIEALKTALKLSQEDAKFHQSEHEYYKELVRMMVKKGQ